MAPATAPAQCLAKPLFSCPRMARLVTNRTPAQNFEYHGPAGLVGNGNAWQAFSDVHSIVHDSSIPPRRPQARDIHECKTPHKPRQAHPQQPAARRRTSLPAAAAACGAGGAGRGRRGAARGTWWVLCARVALCSRRFGLCGALFALLAFFFRRLFRASGHGDVGAAPMPPARAPRDGCTRFSFYICFFTRCTPWTCLRRPARRFIGLCIFSLW